MKTLRFIGITLLLTFLFGGLSSCGGDSDEPNVEPTPVPTPTYKIEIPTTENTKPVFDTEGGSETIKFTASQSWTVAATNDRADEWLSVTPTSGNAGTYTLTITTKANDTYDERAGSITIKSGTASQTIVVTQKQKDALLISSDKIEVDVEGGEVQVEVKANVDFTVETDVDWIRHVSTRSLKTSNLTFAVAENESTSKREGHITIKNGMLLETVSVYQEASTNMPSKHIVKVVGEAIDIDDTPPRKPSLFEITISYDSQGRVVKVVEESLSPWGTTEITEITYKYGESVIISKESGENINNSHIFYLENGLIVKDEEYGVTGTYTYDSNGYMVFKSQQKIIWTNGNLTDFDYRQYSYTNIPWPKGMFFYFKGTNIDRYLWPAGYWGKTPKNMPYKYKAEYDEWTYDYTVTDGLITKMKIIEDGIAWWVENYTWE